MATDKQKHLEEVLETHKIDNHKSIDKLVSKKNHHQLRTPGPVRVPAGGAPGGGGD